MKKKSAVFLFLLLALMLAPLSFGQLASQARNPHVALGYFDPATGVFDALHTELDAQVAAATVQTTGTITFKLTINVKSGVPKNAVLSCGGSASVSDGSGFGASEHTTVAATLVSGTTYSCTGVIDYSWPLTTASTDKISLQVSAGVDYGYQVTATNGTAVLVEPIAGRSTTQQVGTISVPASGGSTTETLTLTL
ncbi:MAG TPA: hypothetical protein VKV39_09675 [Candidatus Sulfotelmatobacter sp.]|nr:hypothetical protein [Candidatus Sulfotelmatobacter sp.]